MLAGRQLVSTSSPNVFVTELTEIEQKTKTTKTQQQPNIKLYITQDITASIYILKRIFSSFFFFLRKKI